METRPQMGESRIKDASSENLEERYLLALALKDKKNYLLLAQELNTDYFFNQEYKQVYKYLTEQDRTEELDEPARLLDQIENNALREQLADLLFEDFTGMSFEDTFMQVVVRKFQYDLEQMDKRIKAEPTNLELFKQKADLLQQLKQITKNKVVHRIIV